MVPTDPDRSVHPDRLRTATAAAGRVIARRPRRTLVSAPSRVERVAPDPDVVALLGTLSRDAFLADLETLAAHHTRRSESTGFDEVATWAQTALADAGYTVTTQPVPRGGGHCRNVIADRPGSGGEPRDVVLVTAHLDSINLSSPAEPAPGADDNGSGSAGLLALARALAGRPGGARPAADPLRR